MPANVSGVSRNVKIESWEWLACHIIFKAIWYTPGKSRQHFQSSYLSWLNYYRGLQIMTLKKEISRFLPDMLRETIISMNVVWTLELSVAWHRRQSSLHTSTSLFGVMNSVRNPSIRFTGKTLLRCYPLMHIQSLECELSVEFEQ